MIAWREVCSTWGRENTGTRVSFRLRYSDRRRHSSAPYIVRRAAQDSLIDGLSLPDGSKALLLSGVQRSGVTRTLQEFNRHLHDVRIGSLNRKVIAVIDLSIPTIQDVPEFLVEARNRLVEGTTTFRSIDTATVDRHFVAFDAIYLLWAAAEFVDEPPPRHLSSARATKAAGAAAKGALSVATLGSFDTLVGFVNGLKSLIDLAGFGKDLTEVVFESQKEGWTERLRRRLANVLVKALGPHLSAIARRTLASGRPTASVYEDLLPVLFSEAAAKLLWAFKDTERCILVIDSADVLNDAYPETLKLRRAICQTLTLVRHDRLSVVLGARLPLPLWSGELKSVRNIDEIHLRDVDEAAVRGSWTSEMDKARLDLIIRTVLNGRGEAPAGDFANAYANTHAAGAIAP